MRATFRVTKMNDDKHYHQPIRESEYRLILMFKSLARSLALMAERERVTSEDLFYIRHIALSSMPEQRRKILKVLLEIGTEATTSQLLKRVKMSRPTLIRYMEEIGHLGLCGFLKGSSDSESVLSLRGLLVSCQDKSRGSLVIRRVSQPQQPFLVSFCWLLFARLRDHVRPV